MSWLSKPLRGRRLAAAALLALLATGLISGEVYRALGGDPVSAVSNATSSARSSAARTVASLFLSRSPGAREEGLLTQTKAERVPTAAPIVPAAAPILPGVAVIDIPPPPAVPFAFYAPPIDLAPQLLALGLPVVGGEVVPPFGPGGLVPPGSPGVIIFPPGTSPPGVTPPPTPPALVPEPDTWAMMLIGFGLLGSTLRRRRNRSTAVLKA